MQIAIHGEQTDPSLTHHLTDLVQRALERFTNHVEKVSLFWKSDPGGDQAIQYGCCIHLQFFNHQTAETAYWSDDLSEATSKSAELAANLAVRCCDVPRKPVRRVG